MRISIRIREFMMNPVIPHPLVDVILKRHGLKGGQYYPERQPRLVGPVSP